MSKRRQEGRGDKGGWSRPMWLIVFAGILAFVAWWVSPFFETAPQQEQCTFGTGSTALYERMKKEADQYLAKHGKVRLANRSQAARTEFAKALTEQLSDFASRRDTLTERIAAMHALLVSYGMIFDSFHPKTKEGLNDGKTSMFVKYYVYLPKISPLCIECYVARTGSYSVRIRNSDSNIYDQFSGRLNAGIIITEIKTFPGPPAVFPFGRKHESCPLVLE